MRHFNLSNQWTVGTVTSGELVLSAIPTEGRMYDPSYDLVLEGKFEFEKCGTLKFLRVSHREVPINIIDKSDELAMSLGDGTFIVVSNGNGRFKIKGGRYKKPKGLKNREQKILLTLALSKTAKVKKKSLSNYLKRACLLRYCNDGHLFIAAILDNYDELIIVDNGKRYTYVYINGCLEQHL